MGGGGQRGAGAGVKISRDVSNWQLNFPHFLSGASPASQNHLENLQILCKVTFMMLVLRETGFLIFHCTDLSYQRIFARRLLLLLSPALLHKCGYPAQTRQAQTSSALPLTNCDDTGKVLMFPSPAPAPCSELSCCATLPLPHLTSPSPHRAHPPPCLLTQITPSNSYFYIH